MDVFIQQLINGLSLGAIYALVAVGYTMVYGILRLINFAHGEVFMFGAMIAYYTATQWLPLPRDSAHIAAWESYSAIWVWVFVGVLIALAMGLVIRRVHRGPAGGSWLSSGVMVLAVMGVAGAFAFGQYSRPAATAIWFSFALLLLASMLGSGLLGWLIELLAYRPLRRQARIHSLITAIGVSLFLQYAGQKIFFGPDPKSFPTTLVPPLLPGSFEKPEQLLPWSSRTVLRFGDSSPAAPPAADTSRVDLVGSAILVSWNSLETAAPADRTGPSTTRSTALPAVTQPTTSPGVPPAQAVRREVRINAMLLLILVLSIVLMVVLRYIVIHTKTGLGLRAVSHRFDTAALMGVNVNRSISFTFLLGSALAGAAGFLYAGAYQRIDPLMGLGLGLAAFVAAVVGGIGSIPGAVAGGFLLGIIQSLVAGYLENGSQYNNAIAYVILILVLMVRPAGLFGRNVAEKV